MDRLDPRLTLYGWLTNVYLLWEFIAIQDFDLLLVVLTRSLILASPSSLSLSKRYNVKAIGLALSLLYVVYLKAQRMPGIWDSDIWAIQADTVVALWLIFSSKTEATATALEAELLCRTVKDSFALYYFASGFWKWNSSFLNPTGSCSTVFFVQLVAYYVAPSVRSIETLTSIARGAKMIAPAATIFIEHSIGGSMLAGMLLWGNSNSAALSFGRTAERVGTILALKFHLMVCFMPEPNDIAAFAIQCSSRLIVFASAARTEFVIQKVQKNLRDNGMIIVSGIVAMFAFGFQMELTPNNWAFAMYIPVGAIVLAAMWNEDTKFQSGTTKLEKRRTKWMWFGIGVAFSYSFVGLMTGLQEQSAPDMFSNLAVHGGSNHFLLPTGILFGVFYDGDDDSHPFGGGVVRIEETTSDWLTMAYPTDMTPLLEPIGLTTRLLEAVGNPKPHYFKSPNRILSTAPPPTERFKKYTVPALELKRLLREAKANDGDFDLSYSQLEGTKGDEIWRATSVKRRIQVKVRDGQVEECSVSISSNKRQQQPCTSTDLPMLRDNAVPRILQWMTMHHPYPIIGASEVDSFNKTLPANVCYEP
eukprot:CAMPEP_0195527722 /NCGR_PEP_ID=MMETSP0794_2-20130614/29602_1 /TAXON_ID=515487 /ORGANISM="Stephanopyxis turris, Strain CCMP 815" /LENGTH=587 /DNA_ID=CAMNT_0040658705 /DNA_START=113 /DNA_END=1876 /DNA_ORIENTATION=+